MPCFWIRKINCVWKKETLDKCVCFVRLYRWPAGEIWMDTWGLWVKLGYIIPVLPPRWSRFSPPVFLNSQISWTRARGAGSTQISSGGKFEVWFVLGVVDFSQSLSPGMMRMYEPRTPIPTFPSRMNGASRLPNFYRPKTNGLVVSSFD